MILLRMIYLDSIKAFFLHFLNAGKFINQQLEDNHGKFV
jgi:hypothetical protein